MRTKIERLRIKLRNGKVRFRWIKEDGTDRVAHGTLDFSRIPSDMIPKGGKGPNGCMSYFDLDIMEWRSMSYSTPYVWIY